MNIEYQDIITLNNNQKFIVASMAIYNDLQYIYLVNIDNPSHNEIGIIKDNESISIIKNAKDELVSILYPLFYENSKDDLMFEKLSEN